MMTLSRHSRECFLTGQECSADTVTGIALRLKPRNKVITRRLLVHLLPKVKDHDPTCRLGKVSAPTRLSPMTWTM